MFTLAQTTHAGAIFGLGAGLALFYYRHKEVLGNHSDTMLRSLGLSLVLNMGYSLLVKNVDNWWVRQELSRWLLRHMRHMVRGDT